VSTYRDPAVTAPLAVAAIPDAAYAVLRRAHADAFRHGVIVVPYSLALPMVLSLYTLSSRLGEVGDVQACLGDLATILDAMESTLENKLERASTMLANGTGEVRGQIGQARTVVARARETESPILDPPFPHVVGVPG
jgi:DNA recombination protein RmuC